MSWPAADRPRLVSVDTPRWVRDAVFYQIFPDRFASSARVPKPGPLEPWDEPPTRHGFKGGDLLGIAEHLGDLAELGVTALYLTPIFASASNHRYHTDDYERVDPLLGGDDALRELIDACHSRGMRVVLDGVFNHSGRGFLPFHHILENGLGSPYLGWFYLDMQRLRDGRPLNAYPTTGDHDEVRRVAAAEGLPAGMASERVLGYRGWWDLPALPKLRVDDPTARAYLLGIAERWIRLGADGWRLDVPEEIEAGYWREFRTRVRAANPEAYIVGEIWRVKPEWLSGDTFDALMDYPLAEALVGYAGGSHIDWSVVHEQDQYRDTVRAMDGAEFGAELERLLSAYDPDVTAVQLNLLGSHDTSRFVTMCGGDVASYRLATVVQMTLPGAPCIYYGDEVGMQGRGDPGSRGAFPWERSRWDSELRAFVRGAIALRRDHAVLRHGEFRLLGSSGPAMAYLRSDESDALVVALNPGEDAVSLSLDLPELAGRRADLVHPDGWPALPSDSVGVVDGRLAVRLAARSASVVRLVAESG